MKFAAINLWILGLSAGWLLNDEVGAVAGLCFASGVTILMELLEFFLTQYATPHKDASPDKS